MRLVRSRYQDTEADVRIAIHNALATGVHDVGSDVVASDQDIADHAAVTSTHGAVSAATANRIVKRNGSGRAKLAAPAGSGDALIKGTRVTTAELPAVTDEKILKGTGGNLEEVDWPDLATHAGLATVHQDAPTLISDHAGVATVHQDAPTLISDHAGVAAAHHAKTPAQIFSGLEADEPAAAYMLAGNIFLCLDAKYLAVLTAGAWVKTFSTDYFAFPDGTLADFQANAATGNMSSVENINDNNTAGFADTNVIGRYGEIDLGKPVRIDQWRMFGRATNNGDGVYKIQYRDADGDWHDWVTGIATRGADWSTMSVESEVITDAIKIIATTIDSQGVSCIGELEVYHS